MVKRLLKRLATALALAGMFPFAALCGFGRISGVFQLFAHWAAMFPGMPGDYLRVAYYAMTLESCSLHSRVSFGSFFAQSSVRVGTGVYIGSYCVIGSCEIGDRTQIGSQVQILSGRHQHGVVKCNRLDKVNRFGFHWTLIHVCHLLSRHCREREDHSALQRVEHDIPMGIVDEKRAFCRDEPADQRHADRAIGRGRGSER